ncbi:WSC domain-containing protein [Colletotrichum plurivorum]|uniref:WSC domain-containing protein n=1 Tax=Colletotrichum plurivorum TaxID=2175906 RepID=A0A8H6KDY1_9PEZI|nr:WSC domain-containing protein [Colletotrichum plurivorum]
MRTTQLTFTFLSAFTLADAAAYHKPGLYKRDLTPPANTTNGYQYQGCFVDVGRTLTGAGSFSQQMTNEVCTQYCFNKGFSYAGSEYYGECYCGDSLAKGGVVANADDCSTPCNGNATQPCGGPNRLTLYKTSLIVGPSVNPGPGEWSSIGCYSEGTTGRMLEYGIHGIDGMTVAKCTTACQGLNYILAGVEYSGECYCGNQPLNGGAPAVDGCNMLCSGNSSEFCGGPNRLNVYDFQHQFQPVPTFSTSTPPPTSALATSSSSPAASSSSSADQSSSHDASSSSPGSSTSHVSSSSSTSGAVVDLGVSSSSAVASSSSAGSSAASSGVVASSTSSSATPTPTGPGQPATVGAWKYYGCQTEAQGARALGQATFGADDMTIEKCLDFCKAYTFAGLEWSRECWCGNSFAAGSIPAPSSDCKMTCSGNPFQYCGEGNRLSVYTIGDATQSATAAASSSAAPVSTGLPDGWTNQGCWVDNQNGRILPNQAPDDQQMTLSSCAQYCFSKGFTVAGAEYHTQCFCGNAIYAGGKPATDPTSCSTPCGGKPTEMCGGPDRMTIMSKGTPQTYAPPVPQRSGLNGSWTYEGCLEDNVGGKRTFGQQTIYAGTLTAGLCVDACAKFGYMAAGLEYGEECYCGDPSNIVTAGAKFVDESRCSITCAGNATGICGGLAVMSTYFWTGTPLYQWEYATGNAAGTYEFFIGGKCIPLMTMETIQGKVTFLEKWGTGPPNSTGAYELDVSLAPDLNRAWREMHVKTDVFCSAGLTLPDKAGRQMNIGGWSGDSTYGVRLYIPSGSAGVNGTTDWQEDAQNLRLQDGRWYPSALVMANGSIFVIGGEEGSNGRAVPTIEVLPFTGQTPLYQDWLQRTDPNNLYPFVAVLPSEDIFVAYWNEARILDKTTFATKTILPNIPGSVTNPKGGRTYPLEGTGVLLPQKAPYTDPLGILICGGSGEGAGIALDNCVTIHPEDTKPSWTIERMPTRRVMSCIAPLPDGTYLINNGAQQGVAGFGLATMPNHNALLYDPEKPLGARITVMANTTISRLYHSESILLLDGRVLVTGSDPEDGVNPQEYRVEIFKPPYLFSPDRPSFTITNKDWEYGQTYTFQLGGQAKGTIKASLLGAVSSTHGNSMGARTIFPAVSCTQVSCTVTAPPRAGIAPPGWYQFFVLDNGIPAVGVYVRIGGDPAGLGNWPKVNGFTTPGV